jgi:protoporphyrinogen oxidase
LSSAPGSHGWPRRIGWWSWPSANIGRGRAPAGARDRLGGHILTQERDGFLIEAGPDSFITQKPWGLALVKRLGLEGELIPTNPACRRTFVVRNGRMHPVPEGFLLLAPTRIWPFVFSRLFSCRASCARAST